MGEGGLNVRQSSFYMVVRSYTFGGNCVQLAFVQSSDLTCSVMIVHVLFFYVLYGRFFGVFVAAIFGIIFVEAGIVFYAFFEFFPAE